MRSTPPLPRLTIHVGVTGHRPERLPADPDRLRAQIRRALMLVRDAAQRIAAAHAAILADERPLMRCISGLAEGADRIAAEEAMALGFELQAVLPFPAADFTEDFFTPQSRVEFKALLDRATAVFAFAEDRPAQARPLAYGDAGMRIVRESDVLIAVWDGALARGVGGTQEVIDAALRRDLPVVWIDSTGAMQPRLLARDGTPEAVERLPDLLVGRFSLDEHERRGLKAFLAADPGRWISSYSAWLFLAIGLFAGLLIACLLRPTFLTVLGLTAAPALVLIGWAVAPLLRSVQLVPPSLERERTRRWPSFWSNLPNLDNGARLRAILFERYLFADLLALRYASRYRTAFIANFLLAALAVGFAVTAGPLPRLRFEAEFLEIVAIALIISLTAMGQSGNWHQRFISYRHLAEILRILGFLAIGGRAGGVLVGRGPRLVEGGPSWVNWYAHLTLREMGVLGAHADARWQDSYRRLLLDAEILNQRAYHACNARRLAKAGRGVARRLHRLGSVLFFLTLAAASLFLLLGVVAKNWPQPFIVALNHATEDWMVFFAAFLPALGAAAYGIRIQSQVETIAERSSWVAQALGQIAVRAEASALAPGDVGNLAEETAEIMLDEFANWRLFAHSRPLDRPA